MLLHLSKYDKSIFVFVGYVVFSIHEKFGDFGNEQAIIWHETMQSTESTRTLSLNYQPSQVDLFLFKYY